MALVAATIAERSLVAPHVVDAAWPQRPVDQVEPSSGARSWIAARSPSLGPCERPSRASSAVRTLSQDPGVPRRQSSTAELGGSGRPDAVIGFAPAGDPTIAVAVIIEGGGTGSEAAVPLGGQLMGAWLDLQH
jgi:peptidoglycan glycosyltransferase